MEFGEGNFIFINYLVLTSHKKKSSFPGVLAYNLSKAAVDQFTRCVALELASKKVRVNSVNPGTYRKLFMKQK